MRAINNSADQFYPQKPDSPHPTSRKIRSFKNLKSGWHFGEGTAFDDSILEMAASLNEFALSLGFYETDTFPGIDGSVMLTVYYYQHYLEFTLNPDGKVIYCREKGKEEIHEKFGLSVEDARKILTDFRKEICRLSESYTSGTMTSENVGLLLRLSNVSEGEYQSLVNSAYFQPEGQSVSIFDFTVPLPQVNPRSSGFFQPISYPSQPA